jgi:hypothetical protein
MNAMEAIDVHAHWLKQRRLVVAEGLHQLEIGFMINEVC